ncbi:MAG: sugar phosphate isomerase/epimerase family protein [Bacteroidota bacterium]
MKGLKGPDGGGDTLDARGGLRGGPLTSEAPIGAAIMLRFPGSYLDFVEAAIEEELAWVEFKYDPPFLFTDHLAALDIARLRRLGEKHGLGYSMHAPYYEVNIGSLNEGIRRASLGETIKAIDLAAELGCAYLTIHGGQLSKNDVSETLLDMVRHNTIQSLKAIYAHCASRGIVPCLENRNPSSGTNRKIGTTPAELAQLCEAVGPEVGITLDLGHANLSAMNALDFVEAVGPDRIKLMHLHDNRGEADDHAAIGSGAIDYSAFVARYVSGGWSFPLAIECKRFEDTLVSVRTLRRMLSEARAAMAGFAVP